MQDLSGRELRCPSLFVFGGEDAIAPADRLADVASALVGEHRAIVVPGADHFWWGQEEVLVKEVVAFFRGLMGSGEGPRARLIGARPPPFLFISTRLFQLTAWVLVIIPVDGAFY